LACTTDQTDYTGVANTLEKGWEDNAMPTYEYRCEKCRAEFTTTMSMAIHDRAKVKCPACQSTRVVQKFSTFYAQTSKKS